MSTNQEIARAALKRVSKGQQVGILAGSITLPRLHVESDKDRICGVLARAGMECRVQISNPPIDVPRVYIVTVINQSNTVEFEFDFETGALKSVHGRTDE